MGGKKHMRILVFWVSQVVGRNGGMEKVFSRLSNALSRRGHQVTAVYCTEKAGKFYTPLDGQCRLINLAERLPKGEWESIKPFAYILKREYLRLFSCEKMSDYRVKFNISKLIDAAGG